jgi:hypothetical protein
MTMMISYKMMMTMMKKMMGATMTMMIKNPNDEIMVTPNSNSDPAEVLDDTAEVPNDTKTDTNETETKPNDTEMDLTDGGNNNEESHKTHSRRTVRAPS